MELYEVTVEYVKYLRKFEDNQSSLGFANLF